MGVTGLWKLVEQSGKPVPLETLENKVLAVDISIWLHQVVKGFQDSKGSALPNAHVLGLFHRLCKLMYYRIKPVFVFDGGVPILKKQTIAKRHQSKSNYQNEADRIQQLLLETLAKEKVVQQALGAATNILVSPSKKPAGGSKAPEAEPDDMFKLPPLKIEVPAAGPDEDGVIDLDESTGSMDEKASRNYYHLNLNAIDVTNVHFKNLPADVRHDILTDIKETRKQSSWGRLHELPVESDNFSSFQMRRLLKRRQVQVELEEAEKEMGGKCLSLAELEALLKEEGVETSSSKAAQQIASDENTRFLLVRDVQKAMEQAKQKEEQEKNAPKPPKLAKLVAKKSEQEDSDEDKEMDEELQLAIKMSLMQDEDPNVLIELDQDDVRMSKQQKENFGNAAQSLARGFMLEYGGMTTEEFNDLVHQTQDIDAGDVNDSLSQMFIHNSASILGPTDEIVKETNTVEKDENEEVLISSSNSDADSDFIDVPTDDLNESIPLATLPLNKSNHFKPHYNAIVDFTLDDLQLAKPDQKVVEVIIKEVDIGAPDEDDIFADIFTKKNEKELVTVSKEEPVKPQFGLKVKKVDDINAKLKEELEILKKAPPKIDLNEISLDQSVPLVSNSEVNLSAINDTLKMQLELLKSKECSINLNEINLDTTQDKTQNIDRTVPHISIENDSDVDSNATIIYSTEQSPTKTPQALKPMQLPEALIEIPDSPKKGTLEHLVVARTPGKDSKNTSPPEEEIPKVPKPFFVNKTPPSSSKKAPVEDGSPRRSPPGAAKQLFPPLEAPEAIPSTSKQQPVNPELIITEMADALKETNTPLQLKRMALDLAHTERELEKEKNKQSRLGKSITEQMQSDCMELLRLFGVPYIVAPMEAEAQCAFLNRSKMTDGTITDDSDIWLFGGMTVYKNFFNQQKLVLEFTIESIERLFQMDRNKLIQLALLVGSDYTTGIHGIGAVTALEILASFPSTPEKAGETSEMMSMLSGLRKFRDWWLHGRNNATGTRITLKSKLKNIEIGEGFPNSGVVDAYLRPTVDDNREAFSWGYPDAESLRDYARQKFGWAQSKTDDVLLPVLKRLDERKSQASIKNYFKVQSAVAHTQLKVSKRVQHAVDTMAGKVSEEPAKSSPKKKRAPRKRNKNEPHEGPSMVENENEPNHDADFVEAKKVTQTVKAKRTNKKKTATTTEVEAGSSQETNRPVHSLVNIGSIIANINEQSAEKLTEPAESRNSRKKRAENRIPDFNPAIPQRLKDEEEMLNRKQKAIELFKKSKSEGKTRGSRK